MFASLCWGAFNNRHFQFVTRMTEENLIALTRAGETITLSSVIRVMTRAPALALDKGRCVIHHEPRRHLSQDGTIWKLLSNYNALHPLIYWPERRGNPQVSGKGVPWEKRAKRQSNRQVREQRRLAMPFASIIDPSVI
jgi:hypothetical protein